MKNDPAALAENAEAASAARIAGAESARDQARAQLAAASRELETLRRQLRSSEERESELRSELQHRVRNMLANVRSVFSRTVDAHDTLEDVADHFRGRLDAIGRYQARSTRSVPWRTDIEEMVRDELLLVGADADGRIALEGESTTIDGSAAACFGLALHELVTNCIKFGVLSRPGDKGRLHIRWQVARERLNFEWLETGVSILAAAPLRIGFGREFIEQSVPYQCDGQTKFELSPGRLICIIALPLASEKNRVAGIDGTKPLSGG